MPVAVFDEHGTDGLDPAGWTPAHRPACSPHAAAAATGHVDDDGLHPAIPPGHEPVVRRVRCQP